MTRVAASASMLTRLSGFLAMSLKRFSWSGVKSLVFSLPLASRPSRSLRVSRAVNVTASSKGIECFSFSTFSFFMPTLSPKVSQTSTLPLEPNMDDMTTLSCCMLFCPTPCCWAQSPTRRVQSANPLTCMIFVMSDCVTSATTAPLISPFLALATCRSSRASTRMSWL